MKSLPAALATAAVSAAVFTRFLSWAQTRPGAVLDDAILRHLPAADCSTPLFIVLYAVIGWTLLQVLRDRERLVAGLYAYSALLAMRLATIFLVPLDPPLGLVPLRDPFVGSLMRGEVVTRDLFFSGHVATAVLMIFLVRGKQTKRIYSVAALAVAAMVLIQRVHYTIDVLAAPAFAWLAYRAGGELPLARGERMS